LLLVVNASFAARRCRLVALICADTSVSRAISASAVCCARASPLRSVMTNCAASIWCVSRCGRYRHIRRSGRFWCVSSALPAPVELQLDVLSATMPTYSGSYRRPVGLVRGLPTGLPPARSSTSAVRVSNASCTSGQMASRRRSPIACRTSTCGPASTGAAATRRSSCAAPPVGVVRAGIPIAVLSVLAMPLDLFLRAWRA